MFEAKNQIAQSVLVQEVVLKLLDQSPQLVRELMKPAEKISDIKILNVTGAGMGGGGANGDGAGAGGGDSLIGKVVNTMLQAGAAFGLMIVLATTMVSFRVKARPSPGVARSSTVCGFALLPVKAMVALDVQVAPLSSDTCRAAAVVAYSAAGSIGVTLT